MSTSISFPALSIRGYQHPSRLLFATPRFEVRVSESGPDVEAAQRLRFQVFNEEHGAGHAISHLNDRDEDLYDRFCSHLTVRDLKLDQVVGTYRVQTDETARRGAGFYSESEFDLTLLRRRAGRILEIGRACVHADYRDGRVISLLWKGLARLAAGYGARYMIGCGSIPTLSTRTAYGVADYLMDHGAGDLYAAPVRPFCRRPEPDVDERMDRWEARDQLPALLRGYLRAGAVICGGPAFDDTFRCADFLVLLDVERMAARHQRHYFRV